MTEQSFVVPGVPDQEKGERLIVPHNLPEAKPKEVVDQLGQPGLPNLWVPEANQFIRVSEFPHLGTGKLDRHQVPAAATQLPTEEKSKP